MARVKSTIAPMVGQLVEKIRARRARAQNLPNIERSIAAAIMIKDADLFFVADRHGDVPVVGGHGYGLYFHDCRFLSGYALKLAGESLIPLASSNRGGYMAIFRLTNQDMTLPNGQELPKQTIGVRWSRLMCGESQRMSDVLEFSNHGGCPVVLPIELSFRCRFEDIFEVRSLEHAARGRTHAPQWAASTLEYRYDGADGVTRVTRVTFSLPFKQREGEKVFFNLELAPQQSAAIRVDVTVAEGGAGTEVPVDRMPRFSSAKAEVTQQHAADTWLAERTTVQSNSILLDRVLNNSLADLHSLRSQLGERHYFAAGIPWYGTLFGRDSLITALQMLAYDPSIAEQTLRLLGELQGTLFESYREEQPGKILHEYRRGELANLGVVPFGRYYGSIDATPLFLILLAEHARWTGSLHLFEDLRDNVERAIAWLDGPGDADGDGFLEYYANAAHGLMNQGWKDSDDAVVTADGSLALPPIAVIEVQGYAYRARMGIAELFERSGDKQRASKLRRVALGLKRQFEQAFWMPEANFYAMALYDGRRQAGAITSNPGQAMWSGIMPARRAAAVARRLMAPDMFTGWGVRTLSSQSARYNPLGYHVGTVWPHDNSLMMAGMRRYALDQPALRIFMGIFDAASLFEQNQLPELFSGYPREQPDEPVRYPVACHPQAWAAGALPYMVMALLGLEPDGFTNTLRVVRPILPPFVDRLVLEKLHVGRGWVSLHFERTPSGVGVSVLRRFGGVSVVVEPVEGV
jgi:glycogen debranching enzyme